jgi:hypothetical protein
MLVFLSFSTQTFCFYHHLVTINIPFYCTALRCTSLPDLLQCHRMSANNGNADSGYQTDSQSTFGTVKNPASPCGMEVPRSVYSSQQSINSTRQESPAMSTLTMRAPTMFPSPRDISHNLPWAERRPLELPSRPRPQQDREELPSIRQVSVISLPGCFVTYLDPDNSRLPSDSTITNRNGAQHRLLLAYI